MTNVVVKTTLASIVLATNWTSIGTFTDKRGLSYDVLQGQVMTNVVGRMEAENQSVEHVFRSTPGPTNDSLKLVLIATQGTGANVPPPLPINPRFVYPNQVVTNAP